MRPHGRADISAHKPRALAICQRCGFMYNHDRLRWQYEWGGIRLINERLLVCETCNDTPNEQLKTIILPPDPVPIQFPVPEDYTTTDNPISAIGFTLSDVTVPGKFGSNIGNMSKQAGLNAAFDGVTGKIAGFSAVITSASAGYNNTVGKWWSGQIGSASLPSTLKQTISYNMTSFSVYAPSDVSFASSGPIGIQFQGSNDGAVWTVLYSTTSAGTKGEVVTSISSNLTQGSYGYHRVAFNGGGGEMIAVAQVQFNTNNTGQNEQ